MFIIFVMAIFLSSVALNYQYPGLAMDLNRGRFLQNGRSGYVLKPAVLREGTFLMFSLLLLSFYV